MVVMKKYAIGVDFGGTNLRAGVCDSEGGLLSLVSIPTLAEQGIDLTIGRIIAVVVQAITDSGQPFGAMAGVGIGACGLVDRRLGHFVSSSVLPDWDRVPLAECVSGGVGLPVRLDNDANAAIFAECFAGVAKGVHHVIGMTLGTAIGGAIVLDGQLYYGANDHSGEFGHMSVDPFGRKCFCGNRGCLGLLAGATGIVQRYMQRVWACREVDATGGHLKLQNAEISAKSIFEAACRGDKLADETITETGRLLGIGTANLLSCFNPKMIVFTGGMTNMGERLLRVIREEACNRTYPSIYSACDIRFGQLIDKGGVVGAAGILLREAICSSDQSI